MDEVLKRLLACRSCCLLRVTRYRTKNRCWTHCRVAEEEHLEPTVDGDHKIAHPKQPELLEQVVHPNCSVRCCTAVPHVLCMEVPALFQNAQTFGRVALWCTCCKAASTDSSIRNRYIGCRLDFLFGKGCNLCCTTNCSRFLFLCQARL